MTGVAVDLVGGYRLTSLTPSDEASLVACLSDGEVASVIPNMPFPYGHEQARAWIEHRTRFVEKWGREIVFAVRRSDGTLIGSVGFDDFPIGRTHNAELGYWLVRGARRAGLGRAAVGAFLDYAWASLGLERVTARALVGNAASLKLLQSLGFVHEGTLRKFAKVGNALCDAAIFGLLREDHEGRQSGA